MMRHPILILLALVSYLLAAPTATSQISSTQEEDLWVEEQFAQMSMEERIGQLFMIRAHSNLGPDHIREVERQIQTYKVGGLCFFQGTAEKHARLINQYQALSEMPLMIAMDAEWGLGMRFKSGVIDYPHQLMLGAIQDNSLIYDFGAETARQMARIGVHINFAPVVDINNNSANPVINHRSFGEDKYNVATKSYMYMRGLQDNQVAACAKHFPGHGDTDVDSHEALPVINHPMSRLENVELFPFQTLINHQLASIMVAHLHVPALDPRGSIPTTLSDKVINQLLRKKMGFDGLVYTDALEMKAVADNYANGMVEVKALQAGNDVLTLPNDIDLAFKTILDFVESGELELDQIYTSTKRILRAKYRMGLHHYAPSGLIGIRSSLNSPAALSLKHALIENALTLARNEDDLVPFVAPQKDIASLAIGSGTLSHFQVMLNEYQKIPRHLSLAKISGVEKTRLLSTLGRRDAVVVSIHNMSRHASRNFGIDSSVIGFLKALKQRTQVLLVVFGNPYSLQFFDDIDNVLVCYNDDRLTQNLAAQALFGAIGLKGRLPVTASERSAYGMGIDTRANFRIGYSVPERVGISMDSLREVDRLVHEMIKKKAAPGAQLLVAKDGKVVYQREYGYQKYEKRRPIQRDHIYDLASVTKIAAATLAIMKLYDDGRIDLDKPIVEYLPELEGTNKAQMRLRDIMAHRAGLKPWIPFYRETLRQNSDQPSTTYYQSGPSDAFAVRVCDDLFLRSDYPDSIWQIIIDSDLRDRRNYRYSDLGFYMISKIVDRVSGTTLDRFVRQHFYDPLHMTNTTYRPLERIQKDRIVPTENDDYFRHREVRGYVHDMGAAMLHGVSGHAGLFSNVGDLIKLFQMLLNGGYYGGTQYLKESTIREFTTRHPRSRRRGIGFDMKDLRSHSSRNISSYASEDTYGHFGFTGTCVWVDPVYDLIYIFLTNRTYPTMDNNLLQKEDYRAKIQSAIYRSFLPNFTQSQP